RHGPPSRREVVPHRGRGHPGSHDGEVVGDRGLRPDPLPRIPGHPPVRGVLRQDGGPPGEVPDQGGVPRRDRQEGRRHRGAADRRQGGRPVVRAGDRAGQRQAGAPRQVPVPALRERRVHRVGAARRGPGPGPASAARMTDLLLVNGTIHTQDPARPRARSIACAGGKVESLDETPPAKRVIDLRGKTVVPGFIDAHVHLLAYGRKKREVDLTGVTDYDELIRRVVERAAQTPAGTWITGSGYELRSEERRVGKECRSRW